MDRRNDSRTAPIQTPVILGNALAIDKEFFFEIGAFDQGMDIITTENLEISVRVSWREWNRFALRLHNHHVLAGVVVRWFGGNTAMFTRRSSVPTCQIFVRRWRRAYQIGESCSFRGSLDGEAQRVFLCKKSRWNTSDETPYILSFSNRATTPFHFIEFVQRPSI